MTTRSPDEMVSTQEVAEELDLSRNMVQKLIGGGKLKATRIGKSYVVRWGDIDAVRDRERGGRRQDPTAPYHAWRDPEKRKSVSVTPALPNKPPHAPTFWATVDSAQKVGSMPSS